MTVEIKLSQLEHLTGLAKKAIIAGFVVIIVMLFHVLVDFFYHT